MSAGWKLTSGEILNYTPTEEDLWSKFNFLFSDGSMKRNSYKFALVKSILDNLVNAVRDDDTVFISYDDIFRKFAECYWNLVVKYKINQMKPDGRSKLAYIEALFTELIKENPEYAILEFDSLNEEDKNLICKNVKQTCKKYVVGALYQDMDGILYGFSYKELKGLMFSITSYEFLLKYKVQIEKLNYYSWAKFLEKINDEVTTQRLIDKLELSVPRRSDLSVYRKILYYEFGERTCMYCGRKINSKAPVDHVLPWSFVKDDKLWNFVLCCRSCNSKKSNKLPNDDIINKLIDRNRKYIGSKYKDFKNYDEDLIWRLREYAYWSGFKEFK